MINQREMVIGEKIRRMRKRMGWTQEELAYHAQIDTSYLGQIERGKNRSPTIGMIGKIAKALSVESSCLLEPVEEAPYRNDESNIPGRIAQEISGRSSSEQLIYYKIFKLLQELSS